MDWSSLWGREGDGDQLTLGRGTARTSGPSVGGWADMPSKTSGPPLLGAAPHCHPKSSQVPPRSQRPMLPRGLCGAALRGEGQWLGCSFVTLPEHSRVPG